MRASGLTDKKMADKRFQRTEYAILTAFYKLKDYPSAKKLARAAGVSRTTLYRHHKTVQTIPVDYEDYLFRNYIKTIHGLLKRKPTNKTLALRTLVFISGNGKVIRTLFSNNHVGIIERILDFLKPNIIAGWRISSNIDTIFLIYKRGILGIIEKWCKKNFDNRELEPTLDNILYLTRTAYRNLRLLR